MDTKPTPPFSHSAFIALLLLGMEWLGQQLSLYSEPPKIVTIVLVALPWIINMIRGNSMRVTKAKPPIDDL